MVYKVYGVKGLSNTQMVLVVLEELRILGKLDQEYEFEFVDMRAQQHKSLDYLEKHPFGQTPVLLDESNGFTLFEARAICRYLAQKCGAESLYPQKDLLKAARFEQASSLEFSNFQTLYGLIATEIIYKPAFMGREMDEQRAKELIGMLNSRLEGYDVLLGKTTYLAGNEVTLADLVHIPNAFVIDRYLGLDCLRTKPNVAQWWRELSSRPSWKIVMQMAEEDQTGIGLPARDTLKLGDIPYEIRK